MRRQVEVYAEWPDHPPDKAGWTCGSGYLLGGRLVLTAAHVVCPAGRVLGTVQVRADAGVLLAAEVVWHRCHDGVDVALLEVTDPGWSVPDRRHPVRWGRLVTTRPGQGCEAIGFPRVVATPQRRDSHHAVGVIHPGALVKAGLSAAPVVEPVELVALAEPVVAPDSPAGRLRADVATTPFRSRPELADLRRWCEGPAWSDTRLVAGAGGQGKTRLARRLAAQLTGDGWVAVVLAESARPVDVAILRDVATPTLVIVDYAEGRVHQLDGLIQAMARAEARMRLLLLARTAGAWRTDRVDPSPHLAVLADDRIVIDLSPVEPTSQGRGHAWQEAIAALAPQLSDLDGYRETDWSAAAGRLSAPDLAGERFRTILAVQMDALAALLQAGAPVAADPASPGDVLLAHENRYWTRVAARFGVTLSPATRRRLVATATLWGAAGPDDARRVLAATLPTTDPDALGEIAEWLATLYQDGERYWAGLQPDPLAEHLVGSVLAPGGRCAAVATDSTAAASPGQLEHGLTLLGRAHPHHPHLTTAIDDLVHAAGAAGGVAAISVAPRLAEPHALLAALNRLVADSDETVLSALGAALPRYSVMLSPTSLSVSSALVALFRIASAENRDASCPTSPDR